MIKRQNVILVNLQLCKWHDFKKFFHTPPFEKSPVKIENTQQILEIISSQVVAVFMTLIYPRDYNQFRCYYVYRSFTVFHFQSAIIVAFLHGLSSSSFSVRIYSFSFTNFKAYTFFFGLLVRVLVLIIVIISPQVFLSYLFI